MTVTNTTNVLMVITSHDKLGNTGEKTGFWLEEFASPYYQLIDAGFSVTLASPLGGQPPLDPKSAEADFQTDATRRFEQDKENQAVLATTTKLELIDANDYAAVFYPGGHGPMWDLTTNQKSIALISAFIEQNKPVAVVCHSTSVLLNVKDKNGAAIVQGKKITGFTNSEEDAVQLTDIVPFLLEDELVKQGANYQKGDDWASFVVEDSGIISGQNPASSSEVATRLIKQLS
ncbi:MULTISPECIES: type 1 glutamine amidotransferase domain-containing protein [unclassified Colwellia]|uniref:type 1 glutamine amidotransferase domain-containing protein n=1 Tax=unclassified Colwellia TaxID=196834 RepID=UPI0015F55289|nr:MULTISPECIES: type 1 glutamine amidotransferase domain-containing protein [unclassified Colwellia]MBA6224851.1 type 1 glutamine amidotransferase domain-containing protein [Colwellia sp. MB3u-45]MBA6268861.1 type 1 glutamine amidotransferase domain-containing protein [Colwellia sp. MB3u-43]MBA6289078.1 type 1 glutamine amidotransferase domain-containing protein [Colwellia sp. MB3u-4]MBA6296218.1 type 1 glutamine amidotransferase domain-containing protein [Colwellia sp. MB02u-9]MBA6321292.1 t